MAMVGKQPFTLKDVFLFSLFSLLISQLVIISCSHRPPFFFSFSSFFCCWNNWIPRVLKIKSWWEHLWVQPSTSLAMQQNPLVMQVNMWGFYRVCFCSVAVDVMPVLFLQVLCSMCWSSLTSACGALWTMKPHKSCVCWSRWDSTLNSLWSVRKTQTSSCHAAPVCGNIFTQHLPWWRIEADLVEERDPVGV